MKEQHETLDDISRGIFQAAYEELMKKKKFHGVPHPHKEKWDWE